MPEAPEVQRVLVALRPVLMDSMVVRHRSLHWCFPELPEMHVRTVHRHGKWIVASDRRRAIMINLGMSGGFQVHGPVRRNVRWAALLERDRVRTLLQFVDPRCMGRLRVLDETCSRLIMGSTARTRGCRELGLGPDAMTVQMDANRWRTMLGVPLEIKRALLAQHIVAGIGNIYASEACWHARCSPYRLASDLTRRQLLLMAEHVPSMLQRAYRLGGTSFGDANSFRGMDGAEGTAQHVLRVYNRAGLPCRRCGDPIIKERQHGRSTYWCRTCQT